MDDLDPELQIATRTQAGVTVVAVRGELDAASTPQIEGPMQDAIARGTPVVLDLTGCDFVDSTGLHAIIDASSELERRGARFAIACLPRGPVERVIEVALPGVLELHGSTDAAVAAVAG